jgi:predicted TPR repeat methyltransferase
MAGRPRKPSKRRGGGSNVAATLDLAAREHAAGRLADSFDACRRVLDLEPANHIALCRLSTIARERGHPDAALEFAVAACRAAPDDPEVHLERARVFVALGDMAAAEAAIRQSIAGGSRGPAEVALAELMLATHRPDEALSAIASSIAVAPELAMAHRRHGDILREVGRLTEAGQAYARAIRYGPDEPEAHVALGKLLLARGELDAAHESFNTYLKLDPQDRHGVSATLAMTGAVAKQLARRPADREDITLRHARRLRCLVERALGDGRRRVTTLELECRTGAAAEIWRGVSRHLIGIGGDEQDVAQARATGLYDSVHHAPVAAHLCAMPAAMFDLIAAPAALTRSFALSPFFAGAARALRKGGLFALVVHVDARGADVAIMPGSRFRHSDSYVRRLARSHGFEPIAFARISDDGRSRDHAATLLCVLRLDGVAKS